MDKNQTRWSHDRYTRKGQMTGRAAARTDDALWQAVSRVCQLVSEDECYNFFKTAGCETK